jgi:hypothetical protein
LKLATPFIGSCFEHAMFKATLYGTKNSKVFSGFIEVSLKETQDALQDLDEDNFFGNLAPS